MQSIVRHSEFLECLVLEMVLGSAIGLERQWRQRTAGLRTNSLVATGSALFILLSRVITTGGDQSRIASYVVSGVGFIGAGVIMKDSVSILQSLKSVDLNVDSKTVEITADLDSTSKQHPLLEQIVSRLSLEKNISAASWKAKALGEDTRI